MISKKKPKRMLNNGSSSSSLAANDAAEVVELDLGPLPNMLGYVLRRTELDVYQGFTQTLAEVGLRPTQFSILTIIGRNPGLRQSQVAEALGFKRANFVVLLDSLEEKGLAHRQHSSKDRRSYFLYLTNKGKNVVETATHLIERHERELAERIGLDNRDALLDFLRRLCRSSDINMLAAASGED